MDCVVELPQVTAHRSQTDAVGPDQEVLQLRQPDQVSVEARHRARSRCLTLLEHQRSPAPFCTRSRSRSVKERRFGENCAAAARR